MKPKQSTALYGRIRQILEAARIGVARTVNTTQVVANWLIGREIVEEQQRGKERAGYGERLVRDLASRLRQEYGIGYGVSNLKTFKQFYLSYKDLAGQQKGHAVRGLLPAIAGVGGQKGHAASGQSIPPGHARSS